jgi:hypothetical protein
MPRILKVPYSEDLNVSARPSSATEAWLTDFFSSDYSHFGDIDVAANSGVEYLFIPVDGGRLRPRVLVLRADNLSCVAHDEIRTFGTNSVGWVAVAGNQLFTSEMIDATHPVHQFTIDWSLLLQGGCIERQFLSSVVGRGLTKRDGSAVDLRSMQGGDVSPDGELLYLTNGYSSPVGGDGGGLRVFHLATGVLQAESTRSTGYGGFVYEFHSGFPNYQEPEGLDFVDATGKGMQGISGKLHVIMLQNEGTYPDAVYLKHYEF